MGVVWGSMGQVYKRWTFSDSMDKGARVMTYNIN